MNCKEVQELDIAERYLLDRLTEPEREEFEKHYFECGSCFSQLQTGLTVQAELRKLAPHMGLGTGVRNHGCSLECRNLVVFGSEKPVIAAGLDVANQG
jgi:hypothetical protein